MAQFLTLLPVLLLAIAINPIVCPSSHMYKERRDRSPYIGSGDYSPQYLEDSAGSNGDRLRKTSSPYKDHSISYRSHEQLAHPHNPSNTNEQTTIDSIVDQNIRSVFSTNFGPGLHLFKNTSPHRIHQSLTDQMVADQPDPYSSSLSSLSSSNGKEFFKVQRSPDGKLGVVFDKDFTMNVEKVKQGSSSSKNESFEQKLLAPFPSGKPFTKDTVETSPYNDHTRSKDSGAIIFPTEEPEKLDFMLNVNRSDCVENDGIGKPFCTNLRNYPEKTQLEKILKEKFSNLESFFGEDFIPVDLSQRMNSEPNEEFLCKSRIRVIYPEAGENKDYNWLVIVNLPNYKQGIRIEECINEGAVCGDSNGLSLPNHYKATCKQSYIYRSLVALTTNNSIIKDQFRMPSCCKCVLKSIHD